METKQELKGLSSKEALRKLKENGPNEIGRGKKVSAWKILLSQFTSPLILILILSAVVLGVIGNLSSSSNSIDVILIVLIVFVSGISGFFQDYKAERSIEAIQKMSTPRARVIRDGVEIVIDSFKVVEGDLIYLYEGSAVPADAKIIESSNLRLDESTLTGESIPVKKRTGDNVYMNTYVLVGTAKAIVKKTGMKTKMGEIAHKLESIKEEKSVFYLEMDNLGRKLSKIVLFVAIFTVLVGMHKYGLYDSILGGVALAVAAIPEGLPAVLVLSLAVGAKVMLKQKSLVRKLGVVESMGGVNIICTDKTGTLTKNEMGVVRIFSNNKVLDAGDLDKRHNLELLRCNSLNNNVKEIYDGELKLVGDETEVALYKFSKEKGFYRKDLEKKFKRVHEVSFNSKRAMMSVVVDNRKRTVYSKGAVEVLIRKCNRILINGRIRRITRKDVERILETNDSFASDALRVLGFAFKEFGSSFRLSDSNVEKDLVWIGLEGITDPPRKGVKGALKECRSAGIRVIMLTGDNPKTAKAISSEIGIMSKEVLIGKDIDKLGDKGLVKKLDEGVNIFARLTPDNKLRIMTLLQEQGNTVAMTGDGVNDSLALKKADVGISMGIRGTEVAKQASDLILLDDNFVTIVSSVREGRRIFDNIRKFVNYLLTSNFAEVAVIFLATMFIPLSKPILLPVQLLWINLLTDGFPALALGIDPARPNVMKVAPRKKNEHVINKKLSWLIFLIGTKKTIILLLTFFLTLHFYNFEVARTALFTGFVLYEFVRIGSIRHQEKLNWFSNWWLLVALGVSLLLQVIVIYSPLNSLFGIVPLGMLAWGILFFFVFIGYFGAILITNLVGKYVKD